MFTQETPTNPNSGARHHLAAITFGPIQGLIAIPPNTTGKTGQLREPLQEMDGPVASLAHSFTRLSGSLVTTLFLSGTLL